MTGKKPRPLHIIVILLLLAMPALLGARFAQAQSISIRASVNKTSLTLDDHLTLSVIIEGSNIGSLSDPELPDLDAFSIVSSSQGSNFSWINGKISISKTINYTLSPFKIGTFTIPSIKVFQEKKTYQTQPISITVSQSSSSTRPSPTPKGKRQASPPTPQRSNQKPRSDQQKQENIFITNTVDKTQAFVNEQIILTFGFYRRIELWRNPAYSQPPLEGFWVEDLEESPSRIEIVNGKQYRVQEIKKALFPMSAGNYTIDPAALTYQTRFFSRSQTLKTKPITIEVLPLPNKVKPKNFQGAVGNYSLSASVDNQTCTQNEPLTFHVKIAGTGHIESIPEPVFLEGEGFQKYETTSDQSIIKQDRVKGEKSFNFLLIPRKAGSLQIPLVNFSFFNPQDKKYHTLTTTPIAVTVAPAKNIAFEASASKSKQVKQIIDKQEITLMQKDIRYIKVNIKKLKKNNFILENKLYWCIILIPLMGLFLCFWIDRRKQKLQGDRRYARLRKAHRLAKKNLQAARVHDKKGEEKEFYEAIAKSLTDYVADKLNVQAAGLTSRLITERLQAIGVPKETLKALQNCLEDCDYARFAPSNGDAKVRKNLLAKAENIILKTEKVVKGKE